MRIRIEKRGNSATIRIPASMMRAARLKVGMEVDIRAADGRMVIDPIRV